MSTYAYYSAVPVLGLLVVWSIFKALEWMFPQVSYAPSDDGIWGDASLYNREGN